MSKHLKQSLGGHGILLHGLLQEDIVREVETGAAAKAFDLSLPQLGPYSLDFTRSGKHVALAGRKGHLAILDWKQARLVTEIQVLETAMTESFLGGCL